MDGLKSYLREQARLDRRRVWLEEALLGSRFLHYARYRLSGLAVSRLFTIAAHVIEFELLSRIFVQNQLVSSLAVQNACSLLTAFWWGCLEVLRRKLRDEPDRGAAERELRRWLCFAGLLSIGTLGGSGVWVGWSVLARGRPLTLVDVYALVCVLRLAIDVFTRTLYSGIYARFRVFRPLVSIVAMDAVSLSCLLAFWSRLGPWSFPAALAAAIMVSRSLAVYYTLAAYQRHRIPLPHLRLRYMREFIQCGQPLAAILWAGLANASTRVGSLIVLSLLLGQGLVPGLSFGGALDSFIVALHLISPLLTGAASWPQVFYLDFQRLRGDAPGALRRLLQRKLVPLGLAVGFLMWGVGLAIAFYWAGWDGLGVGMGLLPMFLAQAHLAGLQLRAFAAGDFTRLLKSSVALCFGIVAVVGLLQTVHTAGLVQVGAMSLAMVGGSWMLGRDDSPWWRSPPGGRKDSLGAWLHELAKVNRPVRIGGVSLSTARGNQVGRLANWLVRRLGPEGAVVMAGKRRILWYEKVHQNSSQVELSALLVESGGLVDRVECTPAASGGLAAIAAAAQRGLLARAETAGIKIPETSEVAECIKVFSRLFPEGLVADLTNDWQANALTGLEPRIRQDVWRQAMNSSHRQSGWRFCYQVSAYRPAGEIQIIFLINRSTPASDRIQWLRFIKDVNEEHSVLVQV